MREPNFDELLLFTRVPGLITDGKITREQGNIAVSLFMSNFSDEFNLDFIAQEYHLLGVIKGYDENIKGKKEAMEDIKVSINFLENPMPFDDYIGKKFEEVIELFKEENKKG